jgi:hypothetical protein
MSLFSAALGVDGRSLGAKLGSVTGVAYILALGFLRWRG